MQQTQTHKYRVISLDVWGHGPGEHEKYDCDGECDGYTVNNMFRTSHIIEVTAEKRIYNVGTPREFVEYHVSDEEFRRALVESGELRLRSTDKLEIDGEPDYSLYVNLASKEDPEDGKPLLHLERVREEGQS